MPKTTLKKTSKLRSFTDIYGETVVMNSQRLTQVSSSYRTGTLWFTTPKEIRLAAKKYDKGQGFGNGRFGDGVVEGIRIFKRHNLDGIIVLFGKDPEDMLNVRHIGCHEFSPTTFNRILRLAGVKGV